MLKTLLKAKFKGRSVAKCPEFQTIIMISMNTIKTITGAKKYCIFLF